MLFRSAQIVKGTFLPLALQNADIPLSGITAVICLSVLLQLPVVFRGNAFIKNVSSFSLMKIFILSQLIQYAAFAFTTNKTILLLITLLVSSTAAMAMIMINLQITRRLVPESIQSTALSLTAALTNLLAIAMQACAGMIIDNISITAMFTVLTVFAVAVYLILLLARGMFDDSAYLKESHRNT